MPVQVVKRRKAAPQVISFASARECERDATATDGQREIDIAGMGVKGAVANLICIFCWTAPLFFLPASVVLITAPHGFIGVAAGFMLMAALLGGPMNWLYRLALYGVYLAVAIADGGSNHSLLGCGMLALMLLMITERPGGPKAWPPSPWFCTLITERLNGASYYATCELRGDLDKITPGRTLYAQHPHGVLTAGFTWTMFWNFAFHERTGRIGFLLDEGLRLKSPTFRLMCDWFEGPNRWAGAASKSVIKAAMARGESLALIPGGFQEATICAHGVDRVYIRQRLGFIKYCLQEGYAVVPCYTFGESDTYWTFTACLSQRLWLAKHNIPACAMVGHWLCALLPRSGVHLITYLGEPLQLPRIAEPTQADVAAWHGKYVDALKATFEANKKAAGKPDAVLEIW